MSKGRNGGIRDGFAHPSALAMHRTDRVRRSGHGDGDVLHFFLSEKQRNRHSSAERRKSLQRACNNTTKRLKTKPAHLVVHFKSEEW